VQDDFLCFERSTQWLQIDIGQWINDIIANSPRRFMTWGHALAGIRDANYGIRRGDADLKQTKFFPIRMQTIGFGIDRDTIGRFDLLN
jgi:hypothetical protein